MFSENGHIERARLLLSQGRIKDAEKEASYILKENPADDEALLLLAECKVDIKQFAEAEILLKQCIGSRPDYHRPHYLLGFTYYQQSNAIAAKEELDKAIALNPWYAAYFGLYAYVLIDEKNYKAALDKANTGLAVYAEDISCLNARSQCLFRLKNKQDAYDTIKEALAVNPEDDFTHTNIGWHFLETGKHKNARQHFREALRINPQNNRARQGYKESLKSNLLPYRWMLMFSLWLSAKSKKARWITIIIIWLAVRLLSGVSSAAGWGIVTYIIIGLYILFVVFSWVGASLANLMLLLSKEGKYVLSKNEKYVAASVGIVILSAIIVACFGGYLPSVKNDAQYFAALTIIALTLPLSRVEYCIMLQKKFSLIYTLLLIAFGVIASVSMLLFYNDSTTIMACVFLAALVVYTWTFSFRSR